MPGFRSRSKRRGRTSITRRDRGLSQIRCRRGRRRGRPDPGVLLRLRSGWDFRRGGCV